MKTFTTLATLLCLSTSALASLDPKAAEGVDNAREGDLALKVAEFYDKSSQAKTCSAYEVCKSIAFKTTSGSAHDEKKPGTPTTYDAAYLVIQFNFTGSTYVGAYREALSAAIVKAQRHGVENQKGVIVPDSSDKITIVKAIDPASVTTELY